MVNYSLPILDTKVGINFQTNNINKEKVMAKLIFIKVGDEYEADVVLEQPMRLYIKRNGNAPVTIWETAQPGDKYAPTKEFGIDKTDPIVTTLNTPVWPMYAKIKCKENPTRAYLLATGEELPKVTEVSISKDDTEPFVIPEDMAEYVDVHVYLAARPAGKAAGLCLPFSLPHDTYLQVFGNGSFIFEVDNMDESGRVQLKYVTSGKAGFPYIINPGNDIPEGWITFPHIESKTFVDKVQGYHAEGCTVLGTFHKLIPAPEDIYAYSKGIWYHYASATSLSGLATYIKKGYVPLENEAPVSRMLMRGATPTTEVFEVTEGSIKDI